MRLINHFKGVRFSRGVIHFGQTKTDIPINLAFFKSGFAVCKINFAVTWHRLFSGQSKGAIAFAPNMPGPWYNARYAAHLANLKIINDPETADCVFVFDDKTVTDAGSRFSDTPAINSNISDITKTHVGEMFKRVFRYDLSVDPLTYQGAAVQKSDANATHDGVIIDCPITESDVKEGCIYQKLIDSTATNSDLGGIYSEEMRIAICGDDIPVIFYKYKALDKRFSTSYARVDVKSASECLSEKEIAKLIDFCSAMGLDFGAIDVLRDKHDGRIYVVDVNKTCMPVLSLPIGAQMLALKQIAKSLSRFFDELTQA
jgi:hypothetical protein